jgi:hypothetical protein
MSGAASGAALNWEGTFTLDMGGDFGKGVFGGGGVATVNSFGGDVPAHLNTLRLVPSRGHIAGTSTNFVTDPEAAGNGVAAIIYEGVLGGTGTFVGLSGGAASTSTGGGIMPVQGLLKICLLSTACTEYLGLPFSLPTTVNGVPGTGIKGLGIGGSGTVGGYGGIRISLQWGPWTIKSTTMIDQITTINGSREFVTVVQKGFAHAPISTTTSTAQPGGMVQLVTPNQVATNLPLGSNDKVSASAALLIRFIPEPGLLLLLGSGIVGMALLGRARMRR